MKNDFLKALQELYEENANSENAFAMSKYMKNKFEFYGIKTPERKELYKIFWREKEMPKDELLVSIVKELWNLPQREFQYFALNLLEKNIKKLTKEHIELFEYLIINKSWWDTVDMIASNLVGRLFQKYPELIIPFTEKWIKSDNMWLQRTAIIFQLKYKNKTDVNLLFNYIRKCSDSKEFFIQKAIGWALREYSKTDPNVVINFVENNNLASLSKREALKVINRLFILSESIKK